MKALDGIAKNISVCKSEIKDFEIACVIAFDKAKRTDGILRKIHHLSGIGSDVYRFMPRTTWYVSATLTLILFLGITVHYFA